MTPVEFSELLDRHGADLARWPEAERMAAQALLNKGPGEAWKHYRAAQLVEQMLREPVPAADQQLMERILAATHVQPDVQIELGVMFSGWQRGLAVTAVCLSLLAGLFAGWSNAGYAGAVSYQDTDDIPGITSSVGDWGVYQ